MDRVSVILWPRTEHVELRAFEPRTGAEVVCSRLPLHSEHPRAAKWLLEALAFWLGGPLRVALVAAESRDSSDTSLYHDLFADFESPAVSLEWAQDWESACHELGVTR